VTETRLPRVWSSRFPAIFQIFVIRYISVKRLRPGKR
jgi:hypothetical protein